MSRQARIVAGSFALALFVGLVSVACRSDAPPTPPLVAPQTPTRGGQIVGSIRTEPRSFNRFLQLDSSTDLVSALTQSKLIRINKVTQEVEPALAESWTVSGDGRRFTLKLRPGVAFSDGHPFTSDDVVFTFAVAYDERANTVLGDAVKVGNRKLDVVAADPLTVVLTFPETFAPGLRLLDNLPILPRHVLEAALKNGTFSKAWGLSTPPSEVVGLGPFVLNAYVPGQRLVFDRNTHYWRNAPDGTPLPYLDRITVEVISDQNAELLRLETGQLDVTSTEVSPESYAPIKRAADAGKVKLFDLGMGYSGDWFWINLKPGALGADPRAAWLQHEAFRRAISLAVDRRAYADTVFLGAGDPVYGPETPANAAWYWADAPKTPHDPAAARAQLATIGLSDRNGDGLLEDASGRPVRFTLLTQKGRPRQERGASVIREEMKKIGVTVDVVTLDGNAVVQSIQSGKYEAVLFAPVLTDTDPGVNPDFWLSSGTFHLWNPEQPKPATDWERRIDELMRKQTATLDKAERKRLYDEMQRIFAEHTPLVYFVAPHWYVAVSARIVNATPAKYILPVFWSADTLAVVH